MPKVRKAELSFLYVTHHLDLFYISTNYHQNIPLQNEHEINFKNKTKGDNSKSKRGRVVILGGGGGGGGGT